MITAEQAAAWKSISSQIEFERDEARVNQPFERLTDAGFTWINLRDDSIWPLWENEIIGSTSDTPQGEKVRSSLKVQLAKIKASTIKWRDFTNLIINDILKLADPSSLTIIQNTLVKLEGALLEKIPFIMDDSRITWELFESTVIKLKAQLSSENQATLDFLLQLIQTQVEKGKNFDPFKELEDRPEYVLVTLRNYLGISSFTSGLPAKLPEAIKSNLTRIGLPAAIKETRAQWSDTILEGEVVLTGKSTAEVTEFAYYKGQLLAILVTVSAPAKEGEEEGFVTQRLLIDASGKKPIIIDSEITEFN